MVIWVLANSVRVMIMGYQFIHSLQAFVCKPDSDGTSVIQWAPFFSVCGWLPFLREVALAKIMKEAFSCCRHINQPEFVLKKGGVPGWNGV